MGGEYMRVLDALSSLRAACSMYQTQASATEDKQRPSYCLLSSKPSFASPLLLLLANCRTLNMLCTDLSLVLSCYSDAAKRLFHSSRSARRMSGTG